MGSPSVREQDSGGMTIYATRTYTLDIVLEAPHLTALDAAKETIDGKLRLI